MYPLPKKSENLADTEPKATSFRDRSKNRLRGVGRVGLATIALIAANAQPSHASTNNSAENETALIKNSTHPNSYEASPANPVESAVNKNGTLFVNGKPTFPFFAWEQDNSWAINNLDANILLDVTSPDLAQSVMGNAWVFQQARPGMELGGTFPNSLGNTFADEPEEIYTPEQFASTPNNGRAVFANFRVNVAYTKMMNLPESSTVLETKDGRKITGATYKEYIRALGPNALVTLDYYPVNADGLGPQAAVNYQYHLMWSLDQTVREVNPNATIGEYIEQTKFGHNSAILSPQIVVGEGKAAIAGKAKALGGWDRLDGLSPDSVDPQTAAAWRSFVEEVHNLSRYLLAENLATKESPWNSPLKMSGRVIKDKNGKIEQYAIILFNASDQPLNVSRRLPGLKNQLVKNVVTNQVSIVKNGKVEVQIPAFDWAIEVYKPHNK